MAHHGKGGNGRRKVGSKVRRAKRVAKKKRTGKK